MDTKEDGSFEFFTDETRKLSDKLVFEKVRDIVNGMMTDKGFQSVVDRFQSAKGIELAGDAFEVVKELTEAESLTEIESKGILSSLLMDSTNGKNLFGLVNAVTDFSKSVEDYDRATINVVRLNIIERG